MKKKQITATTRIWLKALLIGFVVVASLYNIHLSNRPKQTVSRLELSTLDLLSEYDDY